NDNQRRTANPTKLRTFSDCKQLFHNPPCFDEDTSILSARRLGQQKSPTLANADRQLANSTSSLKVESEAERATGIEPAWPAWKAGTLPLSYARAWEIKCRVPSSLPSAF